MPVSLIASSCDTAHIKNNPLRIPLFLDSVSAGFPSPAQDYIEQTLDLNTLCIKHPAATFFVRVAGDSMLEASIHPKDILVVDRSLQAEHGDIVIASIYGELTVKELELKPRVRLIPRNRLYQPIEASEASELDIFGVVTHVIRSMRRKPVLKT